MGYSVSKNQISMTRGDTVILEVNIDYAETGEIYRPREGDEVRFSLKKYLYDKTALLVKDIPTGTLLLRIDPEDTANLSFGRYYYDIQVIRNDGMVDTIITDILEITY